MSAATPPIDARAQRKIDRRRSILDAAARLFAEYGFADCDMERVSAALQIAKGTIYLYFPGKQELFLACVDWGMAEMRRIVVEAADPEIDPFRRIARSIRAYLEFFDQNPHYVELLIQERAMFRERKSGAYFEHREELRGSFRSLYEDLLKRGILRNDLPLDRLIDSVGALLYGTMLINNSVGRSISLEEQYRAVMSTAFGGLVTTTGHASLKSILR